MPSTTPSGFDSQSCRSMRKRCTARSASKRRDRSKMRNGRTIRFKLNGEPVSAEIAHHHNLVEVLRRDFDLFGARESCGQGLCGCCTVLVNGSAVSGCLYLAAF